MRIVVTAPRGKMGSLILQAAASRPGIEVAAALVRPDADCLGQDAGYLCGLGVSMGAVATDDWDAALKSADVLVDFSTVEVGRHGLQKALQYRLPFICGTTGFTKEDHAAFAEVARHIPVLPAANTSRVVHLMARLLKQAAAELNGRADMELIEMHDRNKLDAPSGTSKELGRALCDAAGLEWEDAAVFGRHGAGVRKPGEIGYHSLRAGDISSSHTVLFGLSGERLEITHHAHSWRCFAEGALDCAEYLHQKPPGLYSVEDVFK